MKRLLALALLIATPAYGQLGTSGQADVTHDEEYMAVIAGRGFTVSTSVVGVSAGNYLYAALVNTSPTLSLYMTSRVLSCNVAGGQTPTEYVRYAPTATLPASPTPTAVTVGNRISGGPAIPATFSFGMGGTLPTGTTTSGGFIPTGGIEKRIKELVLIPPSSKLVYAIGGSGGGLAATARCVMTFLGYTQ